MAITTITNSMVSVNAIQGTLIADNAITAVHIASNAVASIQIAENNVTAREIAANTITVAQLADDCVESDKIADGVITTNHLNKAMISSQTEVAVATGDFILLGDTSDSNNLKKAPISSILAGTLTTAAQTNITSVGTLTGLTVNGLAKFDQQSSTSGLGRIEFGNSGEPYIQGMDVGNGGSGAYLKLGINTTDAIYIDDSGNVGIGTTSPDDNLHIRNTAQSGATLRLENSNTSTDANTVYGTINFEGNDDSSNANGIRASIVAHSESTAGATSLRFSTGEGGSANAEKMRITNAGNVGIGTDSPATKLQVAGTVRFSTTPTDGTESRFDFTMGGAADDPTMTMYRHDGVSASIKLRPGVDSYFENKILVGLTSATGMSGQGLETAGSIKANNYIISTDLVGSGVRNVNTTAGGALTISTSLRALKENIVTTSLGLDVVKALTPREFDWKDTETYGTEDIGFIADEVFAVSPKLATYKAGEKTEDNLQGVKYEQLTAVLVKAIQEQQTIIEDLKARIETLER